MPPSVIPPRPVSTARPKPPDAGRVSRNFGPASRQTSEIPVTSSGWPITSACDEWEGILGNALRLYDEMALFESVLARILSDGSLGRFSRAHVKETDRVKQLGFYVDLDDQIRFLSTPSQVTSELSKGSSQFRSRRARDAALDLAHLDGVAKMRLSVSSCNPTSASCGGNNRCTGSRVQGAGRP